MGARSYARHLLARLGARVARDDLFEQLGERAPTLPLDAGTVHPSRVGAAARVVTPRMAWEARQAAGEAETVAPPAPSTSAGAGGVAGATAPAPSTSAAATNAPAPATPRVASAPAASASKKRAAVKAARPAEGCVPVDRAALVAALVPAGKPLVVNHWATWCDPCVDELPRLVRAAAGCGDLAEFLGVSWDLFDNPGDPSTRSAEVAAFADNAGVGYPSVLYTDPPESLFEACGLDVQLVPQTLVLAPDGAVVWHKKGVFEHDDVFPLVAAVRAAAGRSA